MWRFVIIYNAQDDYFDFRVSPSDDGIEEEAVVVFRGLDRTNLGDAFTDLNQIYSALSAVDSWRRSNAVC